MVPFLSAFFLGWTAKEVQDAVASGDLDRAAKVLSGLDVMEDAARAAAAGTEEHFQNWADSLEISGESREKLAKEID